MNLKVVQEVVVPKVTAGILEIEGVMSNTHPFFNLEKITSLEAGTCAVYSNMIQIESMPIVIRPQKKRKQKNIRKSTVRDYLNLLKSEILFS